MYLKTPKRYTTRGRKRYLFSFRRVVLWILTPLIAWGGWLIYQNRTTFAPVVGGVVEQVYGRSSEVVSTLTAPTPMPTENPMNVINRADMNWASGRVEDALNEYETAVEMVPNDVITHYNYSFGLILEGLYDEAYQAAEHAVTADPFSSDAWAVRSLAQARLGDPNGALASGLHALQLNPQNAKAYAFLTEAYITLQQFERAQEAADTAIELNPDSAEAYYARAQVNLEINFDREAARDDYNTAYQLAPYLTDAAVEMAYLDSALGDYDSAIAILNEVKDANPNDSTVLLALGFMYFSGLGDPNLASDELARCVNVNTQSEGCHYYYGRVLIGQERYTEAAEMLERAVQLTMETDAPNPRYHYWAGEAQIYLGNCPRALTFLRPGYELAVEQERDDLISALQTSVGECSSFDTILPTPTEIPLDADGDTLEDTAPEGSDPALATPNV